MDLHRAIPLAFLALATPLPASAQLFAHQRPAVEIEARLLYNTTSGGTVIAGHATAIAREGDLTVLHIAAAPRCEVSTEPGGSPPTDPAYGWRLGVAVRAVEEDRIGLRVSWQREGTLPDGGSAAAERELEIELESGQRRMLDFIDFEPIAGDGSCRFDALMVEVEPRLLGDRVLAGRDLRLETWLIATTAGGREEFSRFEIVASQGEPVDFPIEPQAVELEIAAGTRAELESRGRGTLTAWLSDHESVAIRLSALMRHKFLLGPFSPSSGSGSKLYRARLGETVEIELPRIDAVMKMPTLELELDGTPAEGVEVDGDLTSIDLGTLAGDLAYSVLVRVTEG